MNLHFGLGDTIDIRVGLQHISRITHTELREIICQSLMFGGKKLRAEVRNWLSNDSVEQVAEVLAPEPAELNSQATEDGAQ